jgi:hypothetical protein
MTKARPAAPSGNTQIRIPKEQMERIENFRRSMVIKPSLSETIRFLIDQGLEHVEHKEGLNADHESRHRSQRLGRRLEANRDNRRSWVGGM